MMHFSVMAANFLNLLFHEDITEWGERTCLKIVSRLQMK